MSDLINHFYFHYFVNVCVYVSLSIIKKKTNKGFYKNVEIKKRRSETDSSNFIGASIMSSKCIAHLSFWSRLGKPLTVLDLKGIKWHFQKKRKDIVYTQF